MEHDTGAPARSGRSDAVSDDGASLVLEDILSRGWSEAEIFWKTGRSRRFDFEQKNESTVTSDESGWALRAGRAAASIFFAASGPPRVESAWPEARAGSLRLPAPMPIGDWRPSKSLESSLIGELEGRTLVRTVVEKLSQEDPHSRLESAILEDGASEVRIRSSHGVDTSHRNRLATLRLVASAAESGTGRCSIEAVSRCARDFRPEVLVRRLADLLHLSRGDREPRREESTVLLSPQVATHVLAGMIPLFISPAVGSQRSVGLGRGQVAASCVTVVDDGRYPRGLLEAPVDGEGVPTRARVLIEEGKAGETISPWWQSDRPVGCRVRPGWKDPPVTGATHLYLLPDADTSVATLLSSLRSGYYLIEVTGPGLFDSSSHSFSIPCCGFEVHEGRATSPVACVHLEGDLRRLLRSVRAIARDLTFAARGAIVGSPSLLVGEVGVRGA